MLLTHTSGLPGDVNLDDPWGLAHENRPEGLRRALTAPRILALAFVYFGVTYGLYALGFFLPTIVAGLVLLLAVVVALFVGATLPMTPAQILWINMILTITLGLVLAFEPPEPRVMDRPPRPAGTALLSRFLVWRICFVSLLFTVGVFFIFNWALWRGLGVDTARTMVVNQLVVMEIFYLFNVRYLHQGSISLRGILGTPVLLLALAAVTLAQFAFTYLPVMHTLFASAPVPVADGALILFVGIALLMILEVEKMLLGKTGPGRE